MGSVPGAASGTAPGPTAQGQRLLRNRPAARRVHAAGYLLTVALLVTGITVLGADGVPRLAALLGGHVAAARWHRWIGYGLMVAAAALLAARPRAVGWFLVQSTRFRRSEGRWFLRYPAFLLRPHRNRPGRHEGHFDPGQRLLNLVVVASLAVLSATGMLLAFPQTFAQAAFAWSLRIHRAATWSLTAAVAGHILVASGLLTAYRGTWRAMHAGGRVPRELAERLWPRWAEEQAGPERGGSIATPDPG